MEIELIKQNYLNNRILTENELFLLLENFLDTVLNLSRFENNLHSFYNYRNYSRIKIMILDNGLEIPETLISKIKNILPIERRFLEKESKTKIYLGVFMVIFSIGCYFLFQNEFERAPIFFVISILLFGLLFLFKGINDLNKVQRSNF